MTPRRAASLLTTTLLLAWGWAASPAAAQVGLGAERYEVTITPPKRPGTEAPVDAEGTPAAQPATAAEGSAPAASAEAAGAASAPSTATAAAPSSASAAAPSAPAAATDPAKAPAADAAKAAAAVAAARPASNLPPKTLQVGAFRQKDSATDLRDALAAGFPEVTIVEVQSGGEPLYRVIVGRQPHGPALDDLKRRLAAAGHPSFEVPAPPASGSR